MSASRHALAIAVLGLGSMPALAHGLQPRLTLPETLRGTVQVPLPDRDAVGDRAADTLRELYPRLAACWQIPPGLAGFERTEITARFALRKDGSVIGEPRITFATQAPDSRARAILARAAVDAIRRCTPARITPALGGAIAGRPIALRFVSQGPKGQGV